MSAHLMTHLKCPHCDRKFSGPRNSRFTVPRLKGSLAIHIKATHPEHYVPSEASKKRLADKSNKQAKRDDDLKLMENITESFIGHGDPQPKRTYVRRPLLASDDIHHAKFCPECGCNLGVINEAIKMGRGQ